MWNENSVPEVKFGHEMECWAVVKRTNSYNGKVKVYVTSLRYLNMPYEDGSEEVEWALQTDDGDYYNAVGWHSHHSHPEYSDFYQPLESGIEVLAWSPLIYPELPEQFKPAQEA